MWKFLDHVADRLVAVMGALFFSQIPTFIQQYTQHLAGAVEELQFEITGLETIARKHGKTLSEYLQKFLLSSDPETLSLGEWMQSLLIRFRDLTESLLNLESSYWILKPFTFFAHLQSDIFSGTMKYFQPGINLTIEGLFFGLIGLLFGYFLYRSVKKIVVYLFNSLRNLFRCEKKNSSDQHSA